MGRIISWYSLTYKFRVVCRWVCANSIRILFLQNYPLWCCCHIVTYIHFCILALGSGQRFLYRLGSGLGLVLVLVYGVTLLRILFCMCPKVFSRCSRLHWTYFRASGSVVCDRTIAFSRRRSLPHRRGFKFQQSSQQYARRQQYSPLFVR